MKPQPRYQPNDKIGGRYQVHQVKMGGMGQVYLCLDLKTRQPYALKTIRLKTANREKMVNLFNREIETWVGLGQHPNIVRCFYLKELDGLPFMFLEWVAGDEGHRGADLRSWLKKGPLNFRVGLDFSLDLCRGLMHAGEVKPGLVHRDLKPENVLVAHGRVAKITDFGLAQITQTIASLIIATEPEQQPLSRYQTVVKSGNIAGTPPYMAPEQWRGEATDPRTDIYALGCLLYEMITGQWPYPAQTIQQLRNQHLQASVPFLSEAGEYSGLNPILARCLAKQPSERYASVHQLHDALCQFYEEYFTESPRPLASGTDFGIIDYYNRGLTYSQLHCHAEALSDLSQVVHLDPNDAEAFVSRGGVYASLQRIPEAMTDYNQAISLNPNLAIAYVNRGSAYANLGNVQQAFADFDKAIALNSRLAPAYFNRANLFYRLSRDQEALADYTTALSLDPEFVSAYANRANVYAVLERYEEALQDYNRVIDLDPAHTQAYFNRGLIQATLQRHQAAIADFKQVLQRNPEDAQAYYYLGVLYYNLQDISQALPYLNQAASRGISEAVSLIEQIQRKSL